MQVNYYKYHKHLHLMLFDMFPQTDKLAKWRLISFRIPRGVLDVLPILSCHVECVVSSRLEK